MQWDDDDITTFSSTQHAGNISLCREAVQFVINELTADRFLWPEDATGNITTTAGTREYSLASDFVRLQSSRPILQKLTGAAGTDGDGTWLTQFDGNEQAIERTFQNYLTETGNPQWFYFSGDRTIGMYHVPDTSNVVYRYRYVKGVMVESEEDSLPFDSNNSDAKSIAFTTMAVRIFNLLLAQQPLNQIQSDDIYRTARAALASMMRKKPPSNRYGYRYESCV